MPPEMYALVNVGDTLQATGHKSKEEQEAAAEEMKKGNFPPKVLLEKVPDKDGQKQFKIRRVTTNEVIGPLSIDEVEKWMADDGLMDADGMSVI